MKFPKLILFVFSSFIFSLFLITSAGATAYYVDASMPDDSGNGLSEITAWKTIGKVNSVSFANNDIIKFKRGEVWTDATLTLNGTPVGRSAITIEDYGAGDKPLFDGNSIQPINIDHALVNLTIKNIDISGWNHSGDRATFKYINGITIDGVDFDGHAGANTFAGVPTIDEACTYPYPDAQWVRIVLDVDKNDYGDITIKNCTIVNLLKSAGFAASKTAWCKNDLKAIRIQPEEYADGGKTSGVVYIYDNTITNIYSDMIQMNGIQVVQYIHNNTCVGFGENFIDAKGSRYGKIYNNTLSGGNIGKDPGVGFFGPSVTVFHDNGKALPYGEYEIYGNYIHTIYGDGLYLCGNNNKVYNNYIKDCLIGIRLAGGNGNEIYNNVIETTASVMQDPDESNSSAAYRSATLFTHPHTSKVYNNTIYLNNINPSNGITIQNNSEGSEYKNNIIYVTNTGDYPLYWSGDGSTPTLSNNLYYNPDTDNRAYWNGAIKTTANITDIDTNALSGNPDLQDIGNGRLFPISTSSIVNAGAVLQITAFGLLQDSIWPNNVLIVSRQDQDGYDIGAYEYVESEPDLHPRPPQNVIKK